MEVIVFNEKQTKTEQVLPSMWKNWGPHSQLVGVENGTATMENSVDTKPQSPYDVMFRYIHKRTESICLHKIMSQIFIAVSSII